MKNNLPVKIDHWYLSKDGVGNIPLISAVSNNDKRKVYLKCLKDL